MEDLPDVEGLLNPLTFELVVDGVFPPQVELEEGKGNLGVVEDLPPQLLLPEEDLLLQLLPPDRLPRLLLEEDLLPNDLPLAGKDKITPASATKRVVKTLFLQFIL
jgi:hypothetical protein